jgi:hypothetical protein
MRLSDAGLRRLKAKALYLNHLPSPWPTEAAARDRSNRLLDALAPAFSWRRRRTSGDNLSSHYCPEGVVARGMARDMPAIQ